MNVPTLIADRENNGSDNPRILSRYGHVTRGKSPSKHVNWCQLELLCNGGKL
jgi:hypothetical protein